MGEGEEEKRKNGNGAWDMSVSISAIHSRRLLQDRGEDLVYSRAGDANTLLRKWVQSGRGRKWLIVHSFKNII